MLDKASEDFVVECNVCHQRYDNWNGSTPCCGSIAYIVENGVVTNTVSFFASMDDGASIQPTRIDLTPIE